MAYHYCTKQLAGALDTLQKSEAPDAGKVRELARELEAHAAEDKRLDMYVRLLMRGRVSRTMLALSEFDKQQSARWAFKALRATAEKLVYSSKNVLASEWESLKRNAGEPIYDFMARVIDLKSRLETH